MIQEVGEGARAIWLAAPANERSDSPELSGNPVGLFYAWWRGDPLPTLPDLPGLTIEPTVDERLVAALTGADEAAVRDCRRRGHRVWLARIAAEPVGCGWVAAREAAIGELGLRFALPPENRYLWDFVTPPPWRGRRIYPRLLQTILRREREAERFWVGHDLANTASARGIVRAGFRAVGTAVRLPSGELTLVPSGPSQRAAAAAALLDVPLAGRLDESRDERRETRDVRRET